jgi:hypothetical protein
MSTRTYNLGVTGLTLHAKLQAVATDYWVLQATGTTEAYNVDHLLDYQHSGSAPEMPGCYVFTISDNLAAGFYRIYIYNLDGIVIAKRLEYWDGTEWQSVNEGVAAAKTAAEAVNNLTKAGAAGDLAAMKIKTDEYPFAIQPFTSSATETGRIPPMYLTAYQNSRLQAGPISVVDAGDIPVNLFGKTLKMVAWRHDNPSETEFELSTVGASPSLLVGGDDNNEVSIDAAATNFADSGQLDYRIYDVTDETNPSTIIDGVIEVVSGVMPAAAE